MFVSKLIRKLKQLVVLEIGQRHAATIAPGGMLRGNPGGNQ